jgi:hemolysin activation/secretion protein
MKAPLPCLLLLVFTAGPSPAADAPAPADGAAQAAPPAASASPPAASTAPPAPSAGEAPRAAAPRRFNILEFSVAGNSVLPAETIEQAVYPFLGPDKGLAEVDGARAALEKAYHDAGYLTVLVDIPEQHVQGGRIHLRVTEGRVERLKVSGNRYYARRDIRAAAPSMAPGTVPNFTRAQQDLAALSRTPDRRVTPLLRPGRQPGTVEVELTVEDRLPLHGSLELNNKQSPDTTDRRLEGSVRYDNLWQAGHSVGLSFQNSPLDTTQVEVLTGTYSAPVGGGILAGYGVRSNSNLSTAADTTVIGNGTTLGLRYITPLPGRGAYYHSLTAGFDLKDFAETTNLIGADTSSKPIRYLPFGLQYTGGRSDDAGQWAFNLGASWGIRGLSDRRVLCDDGFERDQFDCKRAGAQPNFAILRGDAQHTRPLGAGWDASARVDFQLASQPLISNEQFAAGGVDSVRGYLDAERTGDDAWRTRFELTAPALPTGLGTESRLLGFVDWAALRLQQANPGQQADYDLGSFGFGLRLRHPLGLRFSVDWARTLRPGADDAAGAERTGKGDSRLHLKLAYDF